MKANNVVAGFLAGVAAGAVLGILFAPDKGSETRKAISQKGTDLMNGVNDQLSKLKGTVSDKYHNVKDGLANKYDNLKEETGDLLQAGKDKAASMKAGVKEQFT